MPYTASEVRMYCSPHVKRIAMYSMMARMTFMITPPAMTMSRCHAGRERSSQGWGGFFMASVSMDSSIMPDILQKPPRGMQPMPNSVSLPLGLNLNTAGGKKR